MQHLKSIQQTAQLSNVPVPSLAIPAMLQQVYESLTQVEQNCEILRGRLHPVLERAPDCGDSNGIGYESGARSVPIAEDLESVAARINTVNRIVIDLLNRVHV